MSKNPAWLRRFSKLTCFSTLFLIFAGSMVTSTGSGLAVPDWPLSYGMVFPPMVGGVFYEHGHRMIAATVGLFTLILAVWLAFSEKRRWVKLLGFAALGAVIAQGVLGGITVLLMLPPAVSVSHAVLSQTFFILTIILAYSLSKERSFREENKDSTNSLGLVKFGIAVMLFVYVQLLLGALMRHTASGLAIPDFPTAGGRLIPIFNESVLNTINQWRFRMNLEPVNIGQILIHFAHRVNAIFVTMAIVVLDYKAFKLKIPDKKISLSLFTLNVLLFAQLALGAFTVWSAKQPIIASLHVVTGAAILGVSTLFTLRVCPLSIKLFRSSSYVSSLS